MDISSLLEVEVKEGKASDIPNNGEIAAYKNIPDFSIRDIASVRFRKLHCTACDLHIGSAPADAHNMHEHPILHVLLCTNCRNFYGDGTFEQGDDATDMFCRWCANGGNLYCCSYCSNTFCYNCIKRNFDPMVRKKIERDEKWKCFVCNPADLYSARAACWALLQHVQTVTRILQSDRKMSPKDIEAKMNLDESQCCPHRRKRKRSETMSDDDMEEDCDDEKDEDFEQSSSRRKRRKLHNAKRKKRVIKLEETELPGEGQLTITAVNQRPPSINRVEIRTSDEAFFSDSNRRRTTEQTTISPVETQPTQRSRNRRSRPTMSNFSMNDDEIPEPLLQCDQTMIEGAESLSFGAPLLPGAVGASSSNTEQPRSLGISPIPTANLLKRPALQTGPMTRGGKSHRLIRGIGGTPVLVRKVPAPNILNVGNAPSTVQSLPMVTIPSRNHMQQSGNRVSVIQPAAKTTLGNSPNSGQLRTIRPRVLPPKSQIAQSQSPGNSKSRTDEPSPNVIDLESDDDESVVIVTPSQNQQNSDLNDRVPGLSTVTHPVRPDDGLMTIIASVPKQSDETNVEKLAENEISEMEKRKASANAFDEAIREPSKSIDMVLDSLKAKLKKVMESAMLFDPDKELLAAKAKTRAVNRTIKRTVAELTSLNDNLVRAYQAYKRERTKEKVSHTEFLLLDKRQKSGQLTPLDMECTRESEPELEELGSDDDVNSDEANTQNFSGFREIRSFRRRVHRAVEARPQTKNKSVQVYDTMLRDCEKSIGYTLLLKADYDPERERDILRPVIVPDENFGKYEEEFINYLQHIEDHGIETEEMKDLQSPDSISINELIEADLPIIAEIDERVKVALAEFGLNKDDETEKETMIDENVEIFEEHVEILTTKSSTSGSDTSGSSDEFDGATTTHTTSLPEKKKQDKSTLDKEEQIEMNVEKNQPEVETNRAVDDEKMDETTSSVESKENERCDEELRKEILPIVDEETVLAVRALIEEDTSENGSNNTDILNSWKSVDSDDECTILD